MQTLGQFLRNPVALIGLVLLVLVAAMALSAGSLFPNNPLDLAG
jgi:peptide/nickel transport system permease protein